MKYLLILLFAVLGMQSIAAQPPSDTIATFMDFEAAKAHAIQHQQDILMVFAGSDWCKPCMQFKEDILHSGDFVDKMKDKLVVLYLDFPARRKNRLPEAQKAHNEALAERYNRQGVFPKIILLDSDENIIVSPKYRGQSALDFTHELIPSLTNLEE